MTHPGRLKPDAQQVLDSLVTAAVVLDDAMCVEYLNPAGETLLNVSGRQASGLHLADILSLDEDLRARVQDVLHSAHPYTRRESRLRLINGDELVVDYSASPLYADARCRGVVLEFNHLDRHRRIAREEALLAQQQASRALARGLAHEIKNPLGGLRGAAQLLQRELADPEHHEYTHVIIREADRLQSLVDRMLGPVNRPSREPVNLHEITEHVRRLVRAEAPDGIELGTDYDPSIPSPRLDRDRLVQALLNIVRNSLQALGERGLIVLRTRVQRQYTIGTALHRLVMQIQVVDNGPGIAEEMQQKMFYPLVTGRADGSGLGLSIAQSLVNDLGGLIECTSEPGHTVFDVLVPLETDDD